MAATAVVIGLSDHSRSESSPTDAAMASANNQTAGITTEFDKSMLLLSLYAQYPTGVIIARVISSAVLALGFPGNFLSAVVWLRLTLRDRISSGVYLTALAISDSVFLTAYMLQLLYYLWDVRLLSCPHTFGICFVALMSAHYLSVLLVLAFNVDRFLAVKCPLQKPELCSRSRAVKVVVGLTTFSLLLGSVQIKLVMNACPGQCDAPDTFDKIWSIVTEALIVVIVPAAVLVLNILLIRTLHRSAQIAISLGRQTQPHQPAINPATDVMLLSISFYLILISVPLSTVFVVGYFVPEESYPTAKFLIDNTCASLYASNFIIYLVTGRTFRRQLFALCRREQSVSSESGRTAVVASVVRSSTTLEHRI